ncbi:MauE/DoxX family redox-associated membrane protein, partial [Aestuariimicrobium sp. T2.26MG-19.2B]|uniref:MauE/DoxX family redox-associated membrane protein n=1 Tax=Aestuariimicrobium sp. T2.26MG-19.2B TaxID=3040679 RepID=UPI00406CA6BC
MNASVLVAVVLSGVLALSGVAKLRDRGATLSSIRMLRLPQFLAAGWFTAALPIGELVLAALVLVTPRPLAVVPAVAVAVLFVCYLAVIGRALTFPVRPTCGCFGRIGDQRVSAKTLVRNLLLVVLAGWLVVATARGFWVPGALGSLNRDEGWWLLAALLGAAVLVLVTLPAPGGEERDEDRARERGRVRGRAGADPWDLPPTGGVDEGPLPHLGTTFPPATLLTHDGRPRSLADLTRESAVLLLGMDCTCASVAEVAVLLPEWRQRLAPLRIMVFTPTEPVLLRRAFDLPPDDLLLDHQRQLWSQLNLVRGLPGAVLLGTDGRLAAGPVSGSGEVVVGGEGRVAPR